MDQRFPMTVSDALPLTNTPNRAFLHLLSVAMRPHQWVKNLFVLAPLLFGMKLTQPSALLSALIAALSFCFLSSALYLVNDVIDIEADRAHPEKQHRPVASCQLSARTALMVAFLLIVFAFGMAFGLSKNFGFLAVGYCIVTLGYCLAFKQAIVLDGMLIATGFVLRVVGGAIAVNVVPTHWLIVCAFLLALFLAFSKRRQELLMLSENAAQHRNVLAQYSVGYLDRANTILLGATIVCYALYTVSPETIARFGTDKLIYGSAFVIYGLLRYLALLENSDNGGNPSKMLIRDKPLLLTVLGWGIFNGLIIYRGNLGF